MSIIYTLQENNLTTDPNDYHARVQYTKTVDLDEVISRMLERGSTVTKADILAVLENYYDSIESLVLDGFKVNTPNAIYGVSIKGTFEGADDAFDSSRHSLEGNTSIGNQFRKAIINKGRTTKQESSKPQPNPVTYVDFAKDINNNALTPGGMAKLVGHRLKFEQDDPRQGIFFVAADGSGTRVDPKAVGQNKPGGLIFNVPAGLPAGEYTLEVRTRYGEDEIRSGALSQVLTVS